MSSKPLDLDSEPRSPADRWWLVTAVILLVIGLHIAGRVGAYCSPLKNDSYIYASFGYRIAHGDVMYRDMSDIKPPGLFMIFALAYRIFPGGRAALVPVESLFLFLAYYVLYRLGRDIYGRGLALIVTIVGVVTLNYFSIMGHVIEGFGLAENFMVLPAVAGVLLYRKGLHQHRTGLLVLAGLVLGIETTFKQTALPVIAVVVVHWTAAALLARRAAGRWLTGCVALLAGGLAAWAPLMAMMAIQGTLTFAWTLLTSDAARMVGKGTAVPTEWREVLPLQWPLIATAWGLIAYLESRLRKGAPQGAPSFAKQRVEDRSANDPPNPNEPTTTFITDITLLLFWALAEFALLTKLPLRSAHYYVLTCVPFILLSGLPFAAVRSCAAGLSPRARLATWSIAIVGAAALYKPAVDPIVPIAIARYRAFDWQGDIDTFNEAIHWGRIHFGRGQPWVDPEPP